MLWKITTRTGATHNLNKNESNNLKKHNDRAKTIQEKLYQDYKNLTECSKTRSKKVTQTVYVSSYLRHLHVHVWLYVPVPRCMYV